ncbi:MAG: 2-hydroxychromene-2-carboxylate isomerase [Myxococcales bacterium]|nr:2-hydroxychromene-2-carboxylate isomerase [Myxococcales bacterium]
MKEPRSTPTTLDFWFEFASTYGYPAAMRVEREAAARGVAVVWKPFLLGPIFRDQGWSDSPFNLYPAKGRYMWRDLERLCAKYELPFRRPTGFPRNGLHAARVALAAEGAAWVPEFVRRVYRANFSEDREIADAAVIAEILRALRAPTDEILARAGSEEIKALLRRRTDEARALGIFGAPSFVARGELFWGNDRLEDALDWTARSPA